MTEEGRREGGIPEQLEAEDETEIFPRSCSPPPWAALLLLLKAPLLLEALVFRDRPSCRSPRLKALGRAEESAGMSPEEPSDDSFVAS